MAKASVKRTPRRHNPLLYTGLFMLLILGLPITVYLMGSQTNWYDHASGPMNLNGVTNLNSSSVSLTSENTDGTMGPTTAEGNWSNTLPYTQKGSLEFSVIDPDRSDKGNSAHARPTESMHVKPTHAMEAGDTDSDSEKGSESAGVKKHVNGPQDVSSLVLTFSKVEVHLANLTSNVTTTPTPETEKVSVTPEVKGKPASHWETLDVNVPATVDLVELAKTHDVSVLGITSLAAGHYTEIRLYVSDATATLSDGTDVPVKILGHDNIVRVVSSFTINPLETTKLTMDIDAQHSVIKTGNGYILKPVVARMITSHEDKTDTSSPTF